MNHAASGQMAVDAGQFRAAMRRPASAVAIIAAGSPGHRAGLTATAVCSLSDTPPMVLACVNQRSSVLATIREVRAFSVNFLTEQQAALAEIFAGRRNLGGDARFDPMSWSSLETGAPILKTALACFDCLLHDEFDSPTHAILIGRVQAIPALTAGCSLIYSEGGFGGAKPIETVRAAAP